MEELKSHAEIGLIQSIVRDRFEAVMVLFLPVSPAIREVSGENGKGPPCVKCCNWTPRVTKRVAFSRIFVIYSSRGTGEIWIPSLGHKKKRKD